MPIDPTIAGLQDDVSNPDKAPVRRRSWTNPTTSCDGRMSARQTPGLLSKRWVKYIVSDWSPTTTKNGGPWTTAVNMSREEVSPYRMKILANDLALLFQTSL